jgi:hypothetical protein
LERDPKGIQRSFELPALCQGDRGQPFGLLSAFHNLDWKIRKSAQSGQAQLQTLSRISNLSAGNHRDLFVSMTKRNCLSVGPDQGNTERISAQFSALSA